MVIKGEKPPARCEPSLTARVCSRVSTVRRFDRSTFPRAPPHEGDGPVCAPAPQRFVKVYGQGDPEKMNLVQKALYAETTDYHFQTGGSRRS